MARFALGFAVIAGFLGSAPSAPAAERERREYTIHIDGKDSGSTTIAITRQDDGVTQVTTRANVKFQRLLFGGYSLQLEATEWWRNDRLAGLKSQATENGKRTTITIAVEGDKLRAQINSQGRTLPAEVWTSTFWKLPEAKFHNKELPMFEIDTGKEYRGKLLYVGTEQLTVMQQLTKCYHFRYTGGNSPTDLWFDAQHRLVRQEFVELGHRTITHLINVTR